MTADLPLLLYPKDVQKLIGVGASKFYEIEKLSDFPKKLYIMGKNDGRPMYKTKEILEWVNSLKSEE